MSIIKLFEETNIRARWDEDEDCWYFVVQDVITFLTETPNSRDYWYRLKKRTIEDSGFDMSTICRQLKFIAKDGKTYKYESANNQGIFRIIQSVPSPKAEPFKQWLAKLGKERLEEIEQPEKAMERAKNYYLQKGYSTDWTNNRLLGISTRNELTDRWKEAGVEDIGYGILTNEIYTSTFGHTAVSYKQLKGLNKSDNLRDNMTPLELILTALSENTSSTISKNRDLKGIEGNKKAIREAGAITNKALKEIEAKTGEPVVSKENAKHLNTIENTKKIVQSESISAPEFDKQLKGLLKTPPPKKDK